MWTYDHSIEPPAPSLEILVRHVSAKDKFLTNPGRLDTGADVSAIPQFVADSLELYPVRSIVTEGYDGTQATVNTYLVTIELAQARFSELETILIPESYVLLGRNILNYFYINLNGPELNFSLSLTPLTK
jgi:hypothetical protein